MKIFYTSVRIIFVCLIVSGFSSCLKEKMLGNGTKLLRIEFNTQTIDINDIDSARLVLFSATDSDPAGHQLKKANNSFHFDLSTLPSGIYMGELAIFTKKDVEDKFFQHFVPINFNVDLVSSIVLPAPLPSSSPLWRKRVIMQNTALGVRAMMPVEVDDPYFEIRVESNRWDSVILYRAAYQKLGNDLQLVREQSWICGNNCFPTGSLVLKNNEAFIPFVNTMKTTAFTEVRNSLYLGDRAGGDELVFEYRWQK